MAIPPTPDQFMQAVHDDVKEAADTLTKILEEAINAKTAPHKQRLVCIISDMSESLQNVIDQCDSVQTALESYQDGLK